MKNRLARYESYFRGLFGLIFPVVLTLGLVYAGLQFSDARQRADAAKKSRLWQEKAEIILAAVRSGHTFSDLVTEAGNRLAKDLEKLPGSVITVASFSQFFAKYFNKSILGDQSLAWFFEIVDGKIECKTSPGLSSTRLRVMQRVFAGLYEFANNKDLSLIEISNAEKFIKGVLGLNSAPLSMGQHREGRLTPVTFEGKKFFFFWRQFLADGKPVAGTIVMFPAAMSEKTEPVLQMVANRVLEETRRHLAVAFLPSRHFKDRLKRIFPADIYADESYLKELNSQLDKLLSENDDKGNKVYESHDHLFLRGFVTEDLPYDAVVFAPRPDAVKTQDTPFLPFAVAISFFWVSVYLIVFWQTGRAGLPLALAFRLLFFFAGLLPIFLLVSAGVSLIDESYNIDFNELRQANSEHLNSINEKSDGLLNIFGYHLSEMLKEKDLQNLLNDGNSQNAQKAFDIIRERLQKLELSLDYMYVFVPGGSSEMLVADQRIRQNVKVNMNLTAPGVYSINKEFARSSPLPEIRLDASQANNYKIMSGLPNNFLMDSFFLSYERENFLTRGTTGKDYQYTVILSKRGMIASYLVFAADSENIYRNFLARELDILNFSQSHLFMAAEHLSNSDFSFFPFKKIHALQGNLGRRAYHFLKKCRGSIFEKYITDQDHLF
ncbi:MAG: hypothetical protein PHD82_06420, partial [Candidatus Riflebacteria bacterium]|nr:hypothetical protein [Candidatus Riflebacteria bacterium]